MITPFGMTLKSIREQYRISQSKLGTWAGFDHSYVSRLESGDREPSRDAVDQIVKALDCKDDEAKRLYNAAGYTYGEPSLPPIPQYGFVVIAEEAGGYSIFYPDCPGCITQAEDYLEIASQARDALRTWCEWQVESGRPLPAPTTGEALILQATRAWSAATKDT